MTCSRCSGLCIEGVEHDPLEGVDMEVVRCLNCGWRGYEPTYHPPITVTKGAYYKSGWDY